MSSTALSGTNMFSAQAEALGSLSWRKMLAQTIQVLQVLSAALALWKGFAVVANTESPIVVVLSGSMEPGFYRGDLLLLWKGFKPFEVGEVAVYRAHAEKIPIVHRIVETHYDQRRRQQLLLTKGDNNTDDDIALYNGPIWLHEEDVLGRIIGYVPYVGYATIMFNDNPMLKVVILGLLGLSLLFEREER